MHLLPDFSGREGVRFLTVLTSLMITGAIAATLAWGHGFWFSVIDAVRQPFDVATGLQVILQVARQPLSIAIAFGSAATLVHACAGRGLLVTLRESPYPLYLCFSWSVVLLTVWKRGASSNYLFGSHLASVLWLSHWLRVEIKYRERAWVLRFLLFAAGLTTCDMCASRPSNYTLATATDADAMTQRFNIIQEAIGQADVRKPKILNLVTHVDGYLLSDQVYLNDPYLYGLLWEHGILSPQPVALALTRGAFDLVAVPPYYLGPGPLKSHEYLLRESLRHRYRILEDSRLLGYVLLIRRDFGVGTAVPLDWGGTSAGP